MKLAYLASPLTHEDPAVPRVGEFITTYTGLRIYPLDARPDEICIEDIAHALSLQCRFSGHCKRHYSVAQHSLAVCDFVCERSGDPKVQFAALLHDAAEAYLVELPRPIKKFSTLGAEYAKAEDALMRVLATKFDFPYPLPEIVHYADSVLLNAEGRDLLKENTWVNYDLAAEHGQVWPITPDAVEAAFLAEYERLTGGFSMRAEEE